MLGLGISLAPVIEQRAEHELNVLAFIEFVLAASGGISHFAFCLKSKRHSDFWVKLTKIHTKKGIEAIAEIPNVDAVTPLSKSEWKTLEAEFRSL